MELLIAVKVAVKYKHKEHEAHWDHLHPRIREMMDMLAFLIDAHGFDVDVTSAIRPIIIEGESGVHATGRAIDVVPRMRKGGKRVWTEDMKKLAGMMCRLYRTAKKEKPACIYHDAGSGKHFHLQTPWTRTFKDLDGHLPVSNS